LSGLLVLAGGSPAVADAFSAALRLAGNEPAGGLLRGPTGVPRPARPLPRHPDEAHPPQRPDLEDALRRTVGGRRSDVVIGPHLAVALLGPDLPELLDLADGDILPQAPLLQDLNRKACGSILPFRAGAVFLNVEDVAVG